MTSPQAKEILTLYRPGTADANDSAFAEALLFCDSSPELKQWFKTHCETYAALRARFKEISVPEGFKEQILAERKAHTETFWQARPVYKALAALTLLVIILVSFLRQPARETDMIDFRDWSVSTGLLNYQMDLVTNDLKEIQSFLARNKFQADYVVPANLQKNARATGCALLAWSGQRVSMICFHSGRPVGPGETSDLFLFVTDSPDLFKTPGQNLSLAKVSRAMTAYWKQNGKTYLLVAAGDEKFIREYL